MKLQKLYDYGQMNAFYYLSTIQNNYSYHRETTMKQDLDIFNGKNTSKMSQVFSDIKASISQSKNLLKRLNEMKANITAQTQNYNNCSFDNLYQKNYQGLSLNNKLFTVENTQNKSKIDFIRQNIVGFTTHYLNPFDIELQSIYVDHTATNRPYLPVQIMISYAKRLIANPHTEFSHYGKFSTTLMHYAHESLLKSFSADPNKYVVLPTGSGSTGGVEKAMKIMKTFEDPKSKPDVFITPYEHHSNILPWVQFYQNVTTLEVNQKQTLQMERIQQQLLNTKNKNLIVSISAASNVTSQVTDLKSFNQIIKNVRKHKNIIFAVDCAAYCCHHELNVQIFDQIDFAYLSPHKNLGGSQTCGLLLAKKSIVSNSKPTFPGGGTVAFVKGYEKEDIQYDVDVFNRQVAGTPPFLGFYRAALCFELLKNEIGYDFIHERQKHNAKLFQSLILNENMKFKEEGLKTSIVIYGHCDLEKRANVITMNIINNNEIMQHSFMSLLLTDIFGIQLRSGCFCAGPFGMKLLSLDKKMVDHLSEIVSVGILKEKPGYLRLDLTFYLQDYEIEYLAKAIALTTRYCRNMELIYTVCNDGEIIKHKLYKQYVPSMYELKNFIQLSQKLKALEAQDQNRLKNRKKTLEYQLSQGQALIKDPVNLLKSSKLRNKN